MITERKLICGTKEEIEEYIINREDFTRWCSDSDFKKQIEQIENSNSLMGLISYLTEYSENNFSITMVGILIRNKQIISQQNKQIN
jgi:hypothetical protein